MMLQLDENTTISFIDGKPIFMSPEGHSPISSYHALASMGRFTYDPENLLTLEAFAREHDIEPDMEASIFHSDGFNSDKAARISVGVINRAYPIFVEIFPDQRFSDGFYGTRPIITERIVQAQNATDLREFVTTLYGEYRKDLVRAIVERKSVHDAFWASIFVGHVPTDWIVKFLNDSKKQIDTMGFYVKTSTMHKMLSLLNKFQVRKLMNVSDEPLFYVTEAAKLLEGIPLAQVSLPETVTGQNLHDHFTFIDKGIDENSTFDIHDKILSLDGKFVKGYTVKVLRSRSEFVSTGNTMNNCAGSSTFTLDALDKKTSLVRLDLGHEQKYLMELGGWIRKWEIKQLFGPNNEEVPEEDKMAIYDFVEKELNV